MHFIYSFITSHPEITAAVVAGVESVAMPFVPVKYNGLAMTIFGFFAKKVAAK